MHPRSFASLASYEHKNRKMINKNGFRFVEEVHVHVGGYHEDPVSNEARLISPFRPPICGTGAAMQALV